MLIREPEYRFDVGQCISHIWFKDINKLLIDKVNNNKDYKTNINIKNKENKEDFKTFIINLQIISPLSIKINSKRNDKELCRKRFNLSNF